MQQEPASARATGDASPHQVFISYASEDQATADAACAVLEQRGIRCWIAHRDILPSVDYPEAIVDAIDRSRVLLLVFSSSASSSDDVRREVKLAADAKIRVLPFRIENVPLAKSWRYFLSAPHWFDALTPPLEKHLERLAAVVARLLGP